MDDATARAGFAALMNQVPETMPVSRAAIETLAAARFLRRVVVGDEAEKETVEAIESFRSQLAGLVRDVVALESRVEVFAGRPGFPDDRIDAILSEFTE